MKWLGLRWRITLALIAMVIAACGALTLTTTQWAADQFTAQLEQMAETAVTPNVEEVASAAASHPAAATLDQLGLGRLTDVYSLDAPMQGFVIPLDPVSAGVRQSLVHQFAFMSGSRDLIREAPQCLASQRVKGFVASDWKPGSASTWSEVCGDYVLGFGFAAGGGGSGADAWLVVRALHRGDVHDPVPDLRATLLTYSALIVAASILVAAALATTVARPLTRTTAMAEAVANGNLDVRLSVRGRDEVARLGTAVNTMADRLTTQIADLEHANQTQRRFVSDVAHELRTPTAALLASAETLENPATRDEAATLVAPQLRRLAALTEDLLEISRMDAGRAEVVPSEIDLVDLVAEVVAACGAPDAVTVDGPTQLTLSVDAARLRMIVRNLLANALQHGKAPVTVTVSSADGKVTVAVHDEGPGVPVALMDRVFDRFVRGDNSRHGASSGLGLAIASENARLLGGTLDLDGDRRTFTLTLQQELDSPEDHSGDFPQ